MVIIIIVKISFIWGTKAYIFTRLATTFVSDKVRNKVSLYGYKKTKKFKGVNQVEFLLFLFKL